MYSLVFAIVTGSFMKSLFIADKNDEWCHLMALQRLFHSIVSVSLPSISLFFLIFVVKSTTC